MPEHLRKGAHQAEIAERVFQQQKFKIENEIKKHHDMLDKTKHEEKRNQILNSIANLVERMENLKIEQKNEFNKFADKIHNDPEFKKTGLIVKPDTDFS